MARLLTIIMMLLLPAWARAEVPVRFQLENGLDVVVQVDRRAPVALVQVWYRVGAVDEPPGLSGLSHVLEHMMFKGTDKVPAGEFSRIVARFGGSDNAFTTQHHTVYFQRVLAHRVPLALELEADRMVNLRLDPEEYARELQVVLEERRQRTDDRPTGRALEQFNASAHVANPERNPIIGWRHELEALPLSAVHDWYRQWYAPNNATVVVVGDVDPDEVRAWVVQYFGTLSSRPLPPAVVPREQHELRERSVSLRLPAQVPALYLGFNLPSLMTADTPGDAYGLRLLAGVLDGGISARLESRLVREGRAAAVNSAYNVLARGDTLLVVTAVPVPGQPLEDLREAVLAEIWRLREAPVSVEEIERVRVNVLADLVFSRDSLDQQASLLGRLASLGLPLDWPQQFAESTRTITPQDLLELAERYLRPERLTTLTLDIEEAQP